MRAVFVALVWLVAPIAHAESFTSVYPKFITGDIAVIASGASGTAVDTFLYGDLGTHGDAFDQTVDVHETGTNGGVNPTRLFDGSIILRPQDKEWTAGGPGQISGLDSSVTFDTLEIEIEDSPVGQMRVDGSFVRDDVATVVRGSGLFALGEQSIPFTFNFALNASMVSATDFALDGVSIVWGVNTGRNRIFSTTRGDVTYTGNLQFEGFMISPEPGSALLLGIGLAGLGYRRRRPAHAFS